MPPALTLSFRTQVQALDPEKEFSFLGETACAITEIAERCEDRNVCVREDTYTTTRNGKSETETRCAEWGPEAWDLYTFSFEISGKAGVYLGTTEELRRYSNPSACDANQAKQLPTYGLSEEIPCWQPAGGIVVADIPSMYNCRPGHRSRQRGRRSEEQDHARTDSCGQRLRGLLAGGDGVVLLKRDIVRWYG